MDDRRRRAAAPNGTYTAVAEQSDEAGNSRKSDLHDRNEIAQSDARHVFGVRSSREPTRNRADTEL